MRYFLCLLSVVFLGACSTKMNLTTAPVILPITAAPQIDPLNLVQFNFKVLTKTDLQKIISDLQNRPESKIVLYSLDTNNYAILDADLLELQRYIEEQGQIIAFYVDLQNGKITVNK